MTFDALSCPEAITGLSTDFIGRDIHIFDELISTNITAREMAEKGAPEGTSVIARRQTGGRGRRGRSWFSPPAGNIYTSIILRPVIPALKAPHLTLAGAVALAEALSQPLGDAGAKALIKWPNDIMVSGRKCAGILSEMRARSGSVDFVTIGIGVNVNVGEGDFINDLAGIATSLFIETGKTFSVAAVLMDIYTSMEKWYKRYLAEGFMPVMERWNALSGINGKYLKAASTSGQGGYETGKALGIDVEGRLLIERDDGRIIEITAGDVVPV